MKQSRRLDQNSQIISAEPQITIIPRSRDKDDFIEITTTGVGKVLSDDNLVNLICQRIPVCSLNFFLELPGESYHLVKTT